MKLCKFYFQQYIECMIFWMNSYINTIDNAFTNGDYAALFILLSFLFIFICLPVPVIIFLILLSMIVVVIKYQPKKQCRSKKTDDDNEIFTETQV